MYNAGSGEITYNTSSIKYKDNVTDLAVDTSTVLNVRAREYDAKRDGSHHIGYIAEELDAVDTHFTWKDETGAAGGVEWFNMVVYLVEEVKKLRAELNALKAQN